MDLQHMLGQSCWRLRVWLQSLDPGGLAGWSDDDGTCPVVKWLEDEAGDCATIVIADDERIAWRGWQINEDHAVQYSLTPLLLSLFIDLVDRQQSAWISREQALTLLDQAECQIPGRLLPQWAESVQRCAYAGCMVEASTEEWFGFLGSSPDGDLHRANCWPFRGRLCSQHVNQLVVPPDSWWWPSDPETVWSPELAGVTASLELEEFVGGN